MKKFFCFVIVISMLSVLCIPISANNQPKISANPMSDATSDTTASTYSSVQAKKDLIVKVQQLRLSDSLRTKQDSYTERQIMDTLTNLNLKNAPSSEIETTMESMGLYKLKTPQKAQIKHFAEGNSVTIYSPDIYYASGTNQWWVSASGHWNDDSALDDIGIWLSNVQNVGGQDGYGVAFTNLSGKYNSAFKGGSCTISDTNGKTNSTTNRSDGNGKYGFGYRLQDYGYNHNRYVGKGFTSIGKYDIKFTNLNGIATQYYDHTWSGCTIDSITFGVSGKSAGLDVSVSDKNSNFLIYSSDTNM